MKLWKKLMACTLAAVLIIYIKRKSSAHWKKEKKLILSYSTEIYLKQLLKKFVLAK